MKTKKRIERAIVPELGDVIGVSRGGIYEHYGVYENDFCVYEYAAENSDFEDKPVIHITTLQKFIASSEVYFRLLFPPDYGIPDKQPLSTHKLSDLYKLYNRLSYHLYTPEQTIERARSKLGESKYSLIFNNCEHYAIWCKTGLHQSHQVEAVLSAVKRIYS